MCVLVQRSLGFAEETGELCVAGAMNKRRLLYPSGWLHGPSDMLGLLFSTLLLAGLAQVSLLPRLFPFRRLQPCSVLQAKTKQNEDGEEGGSMACATTS